MDETDRRKTVIGAGQTDLTRWSDPKQLEPAWESRAVIAADFIAAGTRVLDIGCGAMKLERHLPFGATYQPCDVVTRDDRTIVADLNTDPVPLRAVEAADLIVMLGVWEYIYKPEQVFAAFAATAKPILCSYCDANFTPNVERRRALGWVNDFSLDAFVDIARKAGYRASLIKQIDALQYLIRFDRDAPPAILPRKRVHVISYNNVGNFGDRLGYHLLNDVLPPNAELTWGTLRPWTPVPPVDLLVVGIGNSLFGDLIDDNLQRAVESAKASIGIFGTQYRAFLPADRLGRLVGALTHWYARYEEDVLLYGRGRNNVSHLGDWLINAFPMAIPSVDQPLQIGAGILRDLPIDRTIQHIQRHSRVHSERLHPLLCALTSAGQVAYVEQREIGDRSQASGKFRSMLLDIFGQAFPETLYWKVDRERVRAYKAKVRANTDAMRVRIAQLLA